MDLIDSYQLLFHKMCRCNLHRRHMRLMKIRDTGSAHIYKDLAHKCYQLVGHKTVLHYPEYTNTQTNRFWGRKYHFCMDLKHNDLPVYRKFYLGNP